MPKLERILETDNVCDILDDTELSKIGSRVIRDFRKDEESMEDWTTRNEKAFDIMDHRFEGKSQPWDNAANAKIPLILGSAVKFQSEAGSEILKGDEVVKAEIFGPNTQEKKERSERVKAHMNFQVYHEMENWDGDMDQLLMCLPLIGCIHKKVYFDPSEGTNKSELCMDNIVIHQDTTSPKKARISQEFERDRNFIHEHELRGMWKEVDYTDDDQEDDGNQEFIEQHRRLDLDEDGYAEPYIVTVHKDTEQVVRIAPNFRFENVELIGKKVAKIDALCHFVKYEFIPAPDGSYWAYGWGILLGPLNDNVNTLTNQLLDAGTLANMQGGWISANVRAVRGDTRFKPGEYKSVKVTGGILRDSIVDHPIREPSNTLYALIELLMTQVQEFTSVTDIVAGDVPHANMAEGSILAMIEQGKKTFNAIYKRIYRSMKQEFKKLFELNSLYTDPAFYSEFFDQDLDPKADYEALGYDIAPTANPEFASKTQRVVEAQALLQLAQDPRVNGSMILRKYVEGVLDDPEEAKLMVPEEGNMTPAQVAEQMELAKQETMDTLEVQKKQLDAEIEAIRLEIAKLDLMQKQVEAPEKAKMAEEKTDQAAIAKDEKIIDISIKEAQRRLIEEQIEATKATAQASASAQKVLSGSSSSS